MILWKNNGQRRGISQSFLGKRVTVIGSGYVGLVTATCLAGEGNRVVGVDIDPERVFELNRGNSPIYEEGLQPMLRDCLQEGHIRFTTELSDGVQHGHVIFIAVGTPPLPDGSCDTSYIEAVVRGIAEHLDSPKVIVIKSTVPVGTGRKMERLLRSLTGQPFAMVSNPEFLKEGLAINDFLHPDRVVVGTDDAHAIAMLRELYFPFVTSDDDIYVMQREAAEMVKYASNAFLAAKLSFMNEIAEICSRQDVDVTEVREGMGADQRIGPAFLNPGAGYGGSCFPKDVQALIHMAEQAGASAWMLKSVHQRNAAQKRLLAKMVGERFGEDLSGKTFALWGLAFKPNTDDVREAPSLDVARALAAAGAKVVCYDPKARENARRELQGSEGISIVETAYDAVQQANALILCTEWSEFRQPDFGRLIAGMNGRVVFDGRNVYSPQVMSRLGFEYHSIGRPVALPHRAAVEQPAATQFQIA